MSAKWWPPPHRAFATRREAGGVAVASSRSGERSRRVASLDCRRSRRSEFAVPHGPGPLLRSSEVQADDHERSIVGARPDRRPRQPASRKRYVRVSRRADGHRARPRRVPQTRGSQVLSLLRPHAPCESAFRRGPPSATRGPHPGREAGHVRRRPRVGPGALVHRAALRSRLNSSERLLSCRGPCSAASGATRRAAHRVRRGMRKGPASASAASGRRGSRRGASP